MTKAKDIEDATTTLVTAAKVLWATETTFMASMAESVENGTLGTQHDYHQKLMVQLSDQRRALLDATARLVHVGDRQRRSKP